MPDPQHSTRPDVPNAFDPDFLEQLEHRDIPASAFEAVHGCFWRVVPLDDDRFGLFRLWEDPEHGDAPFAILSDHFTALLAAAVLPLVAARRTIWLYPADDGEGYRLHRDGWEVGQMRTLIPELTDALNLADALVRTPTSLASLLEGAGPGALAQAGKIVARGVFPRA